LDDFVSSHSSSFSSNKHSHVERLLVAIGHVLLDAQQLPDQPCNTQQQQYPQHSPSTSTAVPQQQYPRHSPSTSTAVPQQQYPQHSPSTSTAVPQQQYPQHSPSTSTHTDPRFTLSQLCAPALYAARPYAYCGERAMVVSLPEGSILAPDDAAARVAKHINQSINVTPVAMKLKKLMPAIH
jgi:hypothetical protein